MPIRQQAIIWANAVPVNRCIYAALGGDESVINTYRQVSNISRTLEDNKIVDHSDVDGASPVGAAPTTIFILDLTPAFIGLGKDNCTTRRETFKFGDLVALLLEILR